VSRYGLRGSLSPPGVPVGRPIPSGPPSPRQDPQRARDADFPAVDGDRLQSDHWQRVKPALIKNKYQFPRADLRIDRTADAAMMTARRR
jgi:hypothetical protein